MTCILTMIFVVAFTFFGAWFVGSVIHWGGRDEDEDEF